MSQRSLKVLVYGATGVQSGPVVGQLLQNGHQPFVFTRTAEKAAALQAAGATIIVGDLADQQSLVAASAGMDAIALLIPFFVPNPADALMYGRNAIDAARAAGVKLIVWNASGSIPPTPTSNPSIDLRIDIAAYLRESGIAHITVQPMAYTENLLGPWTAPFVAHENRVAYPTPPDMRVGWISAADVAALMVAALERPELAGQSFVVSGIEHPNGPELAEHFAQALKRELRYHALPPHEFGAILDGMFGPGAGAAAATEYERMWANSQRPLMYVDMQPVLRVLPVQMTTLQAWVAQHAAAFTPVVVQA